MKTAILAAVVAFTAFTSLASGANAGSSFATRFFSDVSRTGI